MPLTVIFFDIRMAALTGLHQPKHAALYFFRFLPSNYSPGRRRDTFIEGGVL
jgi:hypothetical protein